MFKKKKPKTEVEAGELVKKAGDKLAEIKFEKERKERALMHLIRMFRDDKLKLPENKLSKMLVEMCDKIDPDRKLAERELIQKLKEFNEIEKLLNSLNMDNPLEDEVVKGYAEEYYHLLREVLSSSEPGAWDAWEYQSQQFISILSYSNLERVKRYLKIIMESDPTCPYYIKKVFMDMLVIPRDSEGKASIGPSENDERTAEKIMHLTCPGLDKDRPEVFRALVDSLKWRGAEDLQRTLTAVKNTPPQNRKLRGRESCIFIEANDSVHYVG